MSAFVVAAAGFAAYVGSWSIPFHGADLALFVEDSALHRLVTVAEASPALPEAPLTLFGFAVNWKIAPHSAMVLHAVSLLMHLLNGMLLYLVCRRLLRPRAPEAVAMLAGLAFVVHPMLNQDVNYLVARPVLQGTFFGLLAIWAFLRGTENGSVRYEWIVAALGAYVLATGSALPLVALPLVLLGVDRVLGGIPAGKRVGVLGATFAVMAALLTAIVASDVTQADGFVQGGGVLGAQSALAFETTSSFVLPWRVPLLSADTAAAGFSWLGGGLLVAMALCAAVGLWWRSLAGAALLWALAILTAAPCLAPAESVVSARYGYFALAGLALLLPWLFQFLPGAIPRVAGGIVVAALLLGGMGITYRNTGLWQRPALLWEKVADRMPESPAPWRASAQYQQYQARTSVGGEEQASFWRQAESSWRQVVAMQETPDAEALAALGQSLVAQGRGEEALDVSLQALRADFGNTQAALQVAILQDAKARSGNPHDRQEALAYFRHAEKLEPLPPRAAGAYGSLLAGRGRHEEAVPLLLRAAQGREDAPPAQAAKQFARLAQHRGALRQAERKALEKDPMGTDGLMKRAEALMIEDRALMATYLLDTILRKEPGRDDAWQMLGLIRARMRGAASFIEEWGESRRAAPDTWRALAGGCAASGLWKATVAYLEFGLAGIEDVLPAQVEAAALATRMKRPEQAARLFREATEAHPEHPEPWLRLCDLAIDAEDGVRAQHCLAEAKKRGATEEELGPRREKAGVYATDTFQPERTIIR